MLHPGVIFGVAVVIFLVTAFPLRWPLPLAFLIAAVVAALLAGFGVPVRHLVEGGFGLFNLVLLLFAGAFFGQAMRQSGATDAAAVGLERLAGRRVWLILTLVGALLFVTGMFVGIAGIAVLATGVFAVPSLRRVGLSGHHAAAFIAVLATFGMLAPPINVPAMVLADGVNMPYSNVARALLALSLPPAVFSIWYFARRLPGRVAPAETMARSWQASTGGLLPLAVIIGFWIALRVFPETIPDPGSAFVLVVGALMVLPSMTRQGWGEVVRNTSTGVPLFLAAVLITVGVIVQIMALTGIRGWLVIQAISLASPWIFPSLLVSLPLFGGVLTSIGSSGVLGIPLAFAFVHQEMILNVSALSAVAGLAEIVPPTAIAAALASYVVGDTSIRQVVRAALIPMLVMGGLAVVMLIFAAQLSQFLT